MNTEKQTYRYSKGSSILGNLHDEYQLSKEEYYKVYSFYVTYSMCGTQSAKKRSFTSYGWDGENVKSTTLGKALLAVLNLNRNPSFVFTDRDDLAAQFNALYLTDGDLENVDNERAVIGKTSESNNYLRLFYRIRDGFAHGKYLLRFSSSGEKMVIIQDDDRYNVTARIVLKLSTLLKFIEVIDTNSVI